MIWSVVLVGSVKAFKAVGLEPGNVTGTVEPTGVTLELTEKSTGTVGFLPLLRLSSCSPPLTPMFSADGH